MSSSSRKRSDLIERTRYQNPLPRPPFPPKLLNIPTPSDRLADPTWPSRLAESVPLPLVVDSEGGVPLDLNRFPELWDPQQQQIQATNPQDVHPEDAWLLGSSLANNTAPVPLATPAHIRNHGLRKSGAAQDDDGHLLDGTQTPTANGTSTPLGMPGGITAKDVAWLRRTEYIGADRKAKAEAALRSRPAPSASTNQTSPNAEIDRIEATFADITNVPLENLRHPTKKDIQPVESYDLLPDFDTWATDMHLFKFTDAPGQQGASSDPRLALSLLRARSDPFTSRPMMSFYLPTTIPPEMTPAEFDAILLADPDAFDDEDREFFKDQAGQLDDSVRLDAIVRREEMRRRRGWVGEIPQQPEAQEEEDDPALQAAYLDYVTKRAQVTTPYHHQRDYDVEKQGGQEEWQRVLVLNFADSEESPLPIVQSEQSHRIESSTNASQKVAYYHPIIDRMTLRVKRSTKRAAAAGGSVHNQHWSDIALAHSDVTPKQLKRRLRRRAQVEKIDLGDLLEIDSDDSDLEVDEAEEEEEEDAEGEEEDENKEDDGEEEKEASKGAPSRPAPGSDSDDDGDDDEDEDEEEEDLDDDELAGLREEAGGDNDDDEDSARGPAAGGRGSRRAAAAAAATATAPADGPGTGNDADQGDTAMDTDE